MQAANSASKKITRTSLAAAAVAALMALGTSNAFASAELNKSKNCAACHAVDRKLIGPAFKDIATKYAADASVVANLSAKIRNGGVGVWGNIQMPANPQVTQAEAETLVKWIMSQK